MELTTRTLFATLFSIVILLCCVTSGTAAIEATSAGSPTRPLRLRADGNDGPTALLDALRKANLKAFADLIKDQTDFILADGQEKVLLALTDKAVSNLPHWVRSNSSLLSATLLQHVLVGQFPDLPNNLSSSHSDRIHTVGYSMLSQGSYANLPGNNGQAVIMSATARLPIKQTSSSSEGPGSSAGFVNEALNDCALRGDSFRVGTVTVVPIDRAISTPGSLQYTLNVVIGQRMEQSSLLFHPAQVQANNNGTKDPSKIPPSSYVASLKARLDSLSDTPGLTLFVPRSAAVENYLLTKQGRALLNGTGRDHGPADAVGSLLTLAGQHIVEARTLYSPVMRDLCDNDGGDAAPPVTTSSGQLLVFECSGIGKGGKFPSSVRLYRNNDTHHKHVLASAKLVQTDILFANGVMHIIDDLLVSLDVDKDQAVVARSAALRKANTGIAGPLNGANSGDGGIAAGQVGGPPGVVRPPLGQGGTSSAHTSDGDSGDIMHTSSAAPSLLPRGSGFLHMAAAASWMTAALALMLAMPFTL